MFPFPSSILSPLSTASGGQGLNCSPICAPANPGRHFRGALSALRTLSRRKSLWRTRDQQALSHALGFLLSRPGHSVRSRCLPPWSVCASREMGREQQPDASREMRRERHPDAYSLGAVGDLTLRPWAVPDGAIVLPRTRSAERLGSAPAQGLGAASADGQHVSGRKMQTHSCASSRSCHLPPHGPRSQQGNRTGPHNCDTPVTVEHFQGKSCWPQGAGNSKERERSGPTCDNVDNCRGAVF